MFGLFDHPQDFLLDGVLGDQALPGGRMADIRFGPGAAELVSRDAVEEHEHVGIVLQAAVADRLLDSPLPEDLHGADPAAARLGMIRRRRALLDHHAVDAEAIEQQRHRKADRPAAGNEYRRLACLIGGDAHPRLSSV
ncbi:hypothetical protein ACVIWU_001837 [Bradyrhizobium sp. USDA 4509]